MATEPMKPLSTPRAHVPALGLVLFGLLAPQTLAQSKGKGLPSFQPVPAAEALDGNRLVQASLLLDHDALVPGSTALLGLRLEIEPEWHVYWRNNGDTGAPMSFRFETSHPGIEIGAPRYPAPSRYPHDISLDYIYETEVVVLFPVTVGDSVPRGTATIDAQVSWLVCKDSCLPGRASVELETVVAPRNAPSSSRTTFEAWQKRIPAQLTPSNDVRMRWNDSTLVIEAPGASAMTFFPYESDISPQPLEPVADGTAKGAVLKVRFDTSEVGEVPVSGVLEVRRGDRAAFFEILSPGR
ncbi:MAG: protein-disulfide reductase DsbD domain-containing protein [Planctomycetota bacterium]